MMSIDLWTWKCLQCGWEVVSARTVNYQQVIAETLIRAHLDEHQKQPSAALGTAGAPAPPAERLQITAREIAYNLKDACEARDEGDAFEHLVYGYALQLAGAAALAASPGPVQTPNDHE